MDLSVYSDPPWLAESLILVRNLEVDSVLGEQLGARPNRAATALAHVERGVPVTGLHRGRVILVHRFIGAGGVLRHEVVSRANGPASINFQGANQTTTKQKRLLGEYLRLSRGISL